MWRNQESSQVGGGTLNWNGALEEEGMAAHSSIIPGESPRTEKLDGLLSTESQRVGHDWATERLSTAHSALQNCLPILCNAETILLGF